LEITRRGLFGVAAAALAADPERLLWVPGKKLISIATGYSSLFRVAGQAVFLVYGHRGGLASHAISYGDFPYSIARPPFNLNIEDIYARDKSGRVRRFQPFEVPLVAGGRD
jgi:hypothetical protein